MTAQNASGLTAADVAAAVRLGTLDPSTPLVADSPEARAEAARVAAEAVARLAPAAPAAVAGTLPADHHDCGIPGCRHGEAHAGPSQPDRQVKLACPQCGAVARMTATALRRAGAITCQRDAVPFVVAPRRTYSRRGA